MKDHNPRSTPRAGDILIAAAGMEENLFSRTVVYLQTFSEEGAMGFILNRPLGQCLGQMKSEKPIPDALHHLPLFYGGPVHSDHFILIRFIPEMGSHRFHCEMNPDPEGLQGTCSKPEQLRACMGYAGWSAGQLENEIGRGDWVSGPPDRDLLRDLTGTSIWNLLSSGDNRWQALRSYVPGDVEKN